ncbi:DUF2695 domain-containing protein [Dactylosporangium sucinum]|uniref:DUF2695 domain-containing protein n=1 Tax=Dactylosporangium sucinum TaxID=1424081 RepID=A0A917TYS2_9ACTN|nr:DUF2695 domain-containing protein [Dactylosporangium sucinum]GGM45157.1 hypothetical protein GCM10007977_053380 [Dactylosporangium sucinum]
MGSDDERARRKRLRDEYKNAERAARAAVVPLDAGRLAELVGFVDERVSAEGCDHTRRFAERWAAEHAVPWERLAEGLDELGGYCDCEVVMNCEPDEG